MICTRTGRAQNTSGQEGGTVMTDDLQLRLDLTGAAARLAGRQMDASSRIDGSSAQAAARAAFKRLGEAREAGRAHEASRTPALGHGRTRR